VLANGVPVTGLAASAQDELLYTFTVPDYDCRPFQGGSSETCTGTVPPSGEVSILVHAYTSFSNLQLTASYETAGPTPTPTPVPGDQGLVSGQLVPDLAGAQGSSLRYTIEVPAGTSRLRVRLAAGLGDPDLYVRAGQQPTTSTYDCRSFNGGGLRETCTLESPAPGTYHILVQGYSAYSGSSLVATLS